MQQAIACSRHDLQPSCASHAPYPPIHKMHVFPTLRAPSTRLNLAVGVTSRRTRDVASDQSRHSKAVDLRIAACYLT